MKESIFLNKISLIRFNSKKNKKSKQKMRKRLIALKIIMIILMQIEFINH